MKAINIVSDVMVKNVVKLCQGCAGIVRMTSISIGKLHAHKSFLKAI